MCNLNIKESSSKKFDRFLTEKQIQYMEELINQNIEYHPAHGGELYQTFYIHGNSLIPFENLPDEALWEIEEQFLARL
jgi:hypothetical protein